jgi:hypothetical protein
VFERLSRPSEADLDHLHASAKGGMLFTLPAAEFGISSGGWILLCDKNYEFGMLDRDLYMLAIEPEVQRWVDSAERTKKELSALAKYG